MLLWAEGSGAGRRAEWVEVAGGVTAEKNRFRAKILDGKTKRVQFNRDGIIASESTNRD
jgi:hypothetical protein